MSNSYQDRLVPLGSFENPTGTSADVKKICCSFKTKNPQKVMLLGVVRVGGGKCPPNFVPKRDFGFIKLTKRVKTWADPCYGAGPYIFTQDGATPHTARITSEWLKSNNPGYWAPELWPHNSPQITPLDKTMWSYLQSRVNSTSHESIATLKAAIKKCWNLMPKGDVKRWCLHFSRDLEKLNRNGSSL